MNQSLFDLFSNVEDNMIRWVITLPAIWRDEAKYFMREAAKEVSCVKNGFGLSNAQ